MRNKIKGIILEGVDCSGKTTLLNHLATVLSRYGWDTIDLRHRKENQFERYSRSYSNSDLVLFDRGHFSEVIYGNTWRGGNHFSSKELTWLNEFVYNNFITIVAYAPEDILRKRYSERDIDQIIKQNELINVQNQFIEYFKSQKNNENVILYNSSNFENLDKVKEQVFKLINVDPDHRPIVKDEKSIVSSKTNILLEGVNGSGKSTIAKLFKINMVGWSIKTLDYKPIPPFERYLADYTNNLYSIFDRGHISEIAYGNIFRKGNHFNKTQLQLLRQYSDLKFEIVFCDPPIDVIIDRIDKVKYPKHIHESRIKDIRYEMLNELENSNSPYHIVDTSNDFEIQEYVNKISKSFEAIPYSEMGWDLPKQ